MRRHISYANVMATVAVFIAIGGGAYALTLPKGSVGKKQLKDNAVVSSKVKPGSLEASDFGPGELPAGAPGAQGLPGATGAAGTAKAYAYVNGNGSVEESRSKGITDSNVEKCSGSNGIYGVRGLSFTPQNVVATVDSTSTSSGAVSTAVATFAGPVFGCQASQFFVYQTAGDGSFPSNKPFYLLVN
jgi:hypothetical protein